jgi:hypothetical protein
LGVASTKSPCENEQLLVTFENRTHVFKKVGNRYAHSGESELLHEILSFVSSFTGWPEHRLAVESLIKPFCTVRAVSSIRGGKGGFGTLLKGQSRQAANKTTLDFGSCRDLQGRRLRTVNDEIAQRLRREWQQKVDTGQATQQEMIQALSDTNSGIAGWFLQLPAWAEKGSRRVARKQHHLQFRTWKNQERERQLDRERQRQAQERVVENYVQSTQRSLKAVTSHLHEAVQQGLLAASASSSSSEKQKPQIEDQSSRKRKDRGYGYGYGDDDGAVEPHAGSGKAAALLASKSTGKDSDDLGTAAGLEGKYPTDPPRSASSEETDPSSSPLPSALVTLSGEVVEVASNDGKTPSGLQGVSNFATIGVLLRADTFPSESPSEMRNGGGGGGGLYYEVVVRTGGLVQIGWLLDPGAMSSESGDGVGDAPGSWSYDGSRQIKLQCSPSGADDPPSSAASADHSDAPPTTLSSEKYGSRWKGGDVVGCLWRSDPAGDSIRYFLNGVDQGAAFDGLVLAGGQAIVPAVSLNPGEVVEFRLNRDEFQYFSEIGGGDATPVGDVLLKQVLSKEAASRPADTSSERQQENKQDRESHRVETSKSAITSPWRQESEDMSPINLDDYNAVESLEGLGLERLKLALAARGLKCGGTVKERAARLFAVKGLSPQDYPKKLSAPKK